MAAEDVERMLSVVQQIRLDILAADVCDRLSEMGIPHAVIKGVTTARWLYDPPRSYRDVDILVPGSRISDTVAALAEIASASTGSFGEEASHSQVLVTSSGAEIDVHGALPTGDVNPRDPDHLWRVLGPHTVPFEVDGRTMTALDVPGRCVVLAMHVLASGYDSEQVREDFRRARAAVTIDEWVEAQRISDQLAIAGSFSAAVDFSEGRSIDHVIGEARIRLGGGSAAAIQLERILTMDRRSAALLLAREAWPSRDFMIRYDARSGQSWIALITIRSLRLMKLMPFVFRALGRRMSLPKRHLRP